MIVDRYAIPVFTVVALALVAGLRLGIIGPRWELSCDGAPCGDLDAHTKVFDLRPYKDGRMHHFYARYARGFRSLEISQAYVWDGGGEAETGWGTVRLTAPRGGTMAGLVTPWYALALYGGAKPQLRFFIGTAVPRGRRYSALRGGVICSARGCEYPDEAPQ